MRDYLELTNSFDKRINLLYIQIKNGPYALNIFNIINDIHNRNFYTPQGHSRLHHFKDLEPLQPSSYSDVWSLDAAAYLIFLAKSFSF